MAKPVEGVPRDTIARNMIGAIESALRTLSPEAAVEVRPRLDAARLFDQTMSRQMDVYAEVCLGLFPDSRENVIGALLESPVGKVRAIAAVAAVLASGEHLDAQLAWLRRIAAMDGTWPREQACSLLHGLVIRHGVQTIVEQIRSWTRDPNDGVRRLVTESLRPRLIMAPHIDELKHDPSILKSVLAPLLDDPSQYVRTSVANCLNDVSKDHAGTVLEWAREWSAGGQSTARSRLLSRALRTLVKAGNAEALALLGYADAGVLSVKWKHTLPQTVERNMILPFEIVISNSLRRPATVIALIEMDMPGRGAARRKALYHIGTASIPPSGSKTLHRSIHFADKTTQTKEPGRYLLRLAINGMPFGIQRFDVR